MAHSSFGLIPMSREYEIEYIENQISEITDAIDRISLETSDKKLSVKKIEKMKKNLEVKLKKLIEDTKRDNVVNFEELGIDFLVVDEAHLFKNLPMFSKMHNVAGINNSESKKATDLLMKCNYLEKRSNNGKAIVFATGTAISNSMCEMYAMQKFLQMVHLKELGLEHFDSWASTFGEVVESFEMTPDGSGFRTKSRFASFQNIPELMTIFGEVADIKTAKDLNLNIPKLKGGERKIIVAPQSKELKVLIEKFAERSEIIHQGIDSRIDNMLKVTNDGRKAALELRVYNPNLPDLADSKINLAVDNIYNIWFDNIDKRSTQLVFCDLSTPKDDGSFNVYDDIKQKLIKRGVPENEIEFIHNAKTSIQRQNLFDDVNNGIVRILIGSTNKMGAGMNVQKKLIALHHLDCPWRPSDLEQREGRILRQGNENEEVEIFTYVTEGSFDAYSYQLIQTKAEFINQILTHSYNGREAEDIDRDTLTYAEVKAIASGNKLVLDKFKVDNELQKLYVSKARYDKNIHELTKKCNQELPRKIKNLNELLNNYIKDNKRVIDLSGENFNMKIRDNILTSRKDASTSLYKSLSLLKVSTESKIGEISGFDIIGMIEPLNFTPLVFLKGNGKYKVEIYKNDEIGNIIRLENFLKSFDKKISDTNYQIEFNEKQLNDAKEELAKPFANGDRIKELQKEKARIDSELDLDKQGQDVFVSEEDDEKINKKDKDNSLER